MWGIGWVLRSSVGMDFAASPHGRSLRKLFGNAFGFFIWCSDQAFNSGGDGGKRKPNIPAEEGEVVPPLCTGPGEENTAYCSGGELEIDRHAVFDGEAVADRNCEVAAKGVYSVNITGDIADYIEGVDGVVE